MLRESRCMQFLGDQSPPLPLPVPPLKLTCRRLEEVIRSGNSRENTAGLQVKTAMHFELVYMLSMNANSEVPYASKVFLISAKKQSVSVHFLLRRLLH